MYNPIRDQQDTTNTPADAQAGFAYMIHKGMKIPERVSMSLSSTAPVTKTPPSFGRQRNQQLRYAWEEGVFSRWHLLKNGSF